MTVRLAKGKWMTENQPEVFRSNVSEKLQTRPVV